MWSSCTNLKALSWTMASGTLQKCKYAIGSVGAYLMGYDAVSAVRRYILTNLVSKK